MAAGDACLGSAFAGLRDGGDARRRPDGRGDQAGSDAAIEGQGVHHREADHHTQGHRSEITGAQGHRSEVDEAGGGRQEGRRDEEAEDRARPQGGRAQGDRAQADHCSEVTGSQADHDTQSHRSEVDEAGGGRQEGRRDQEADDRARPQGGRAQGDRPQADHCSEVTGSQADHDTQSHRSEITGAQGHRSEVDEAGGGRQEGRRDQEAEDGAGEEGALPELPLTGSGVGRSDRSDRDPNGREASEFVGDSPGEPFEQSDEPVAADKPGTTAEEHRERFLDRRLAMDEPDASPAGSSGGPPTSATVLDDDVAPEDLVTEDPDVRPEEADLDRTSEELGELSLDPAESAEESAMHIERE